MSAGQARALRRARRAELGILGDSQIPGMAMIIGYGAAAGAGAALAASTQKTRGRQVVVGSVAGGAIAATTLGLLFVWARG